MLQVSRRVVALLGPAAVVALAAGCLPSGTPPTFRAPTTVANPRGSSAVTDSTAIGDVTGDGRPDLVAALGPVGTPSGALVVYPQTAAGTLGSPRQISDGSHYSSGDTVTLADLDHDGHLDAVVAGFGVDVFRQQGGTLVRISHADWPAEDVQVADINRDGRPDLVTAEIQSDETATAVVHLQRVDGTFGPGSTVGAPVHYPNPGPEVDVADLNGDGRPDLIGGERYGFWVALQTGSGAFGTARHYALPGATDGDLGPLDFAVGDLTGDGRPDVVVPRADDQPQAAVEVFVDRPDGTFGTPTIRPTADSPGSVEIADVTGDGRKDLLVSHFGWREFGVYAQRSDGTLAPESLTPISGGPYENRTVSAGDLNSDGLADVAIAEGASPGGSVQVLYQHS